ncbi:tryptophan 7-halogenase [Sphingomonas sp. DG1-23]|uniref:tryptophan halogenase family protein n=1 Tax=Sphingomonas sp. DG1-23 TaxID=3068316 RepID=UPI00273D6EDA|nr:tryptophan halogenase family protein [Sphingomonas sp. DG1-23]MDP5281428.1 tryptophan 7-halogenase [Sphingomonas sp. DG1-23]
MTNSVRKVVIVGGGTAGWLTAGYLARLLAADRPGGAAITLVESSEIGILGVGEGTFPTIRKTLARIGVREADLVRRCGASFKQGASFINWRYAPGAPGGDHFLHAFQEAAREGPELLPYWLLGVAGDRPWDMVSTPQRRAVDACRAPKLTSHPDYVGPLNYAFHFDAGAFAELLREQGIANGVSHLADTVEEVHLAGDGSIAALSLRQNGRFTADLYIDCSGFRAELIGKALRQPWTSCRSTLFCDAAIALQLPNQHPDEAIASSTLATGQASGWIWDIGLASRRGIGHVYSSAHCDAEQAERALRAYAGPAAKGLETRSFRFDAGYRETSWYKNCVAVGLSSGFFEPLEATGIVFSEVAASLIANLFPWAGDFETSARQFNANMRRRYARTLDFLKMHYCLSERRDSDFWNDNVDPRSIPDSLSELLDRWRHRPPNELDIDANVDIFPEASWQYVLYGMGWKTDLSARASACRFADEAQESFAEVQRHGDYAVRQLPSNREIIRFAQGASFGEGAHAA